MFNISINSSSFTWLNGKFDKKCEHTLNATFLWYNDNPGGTTILVNHLLFFVFMKDGVTYEGGGAK